MNGPQGFDRTRNTEIGVKNIKVSYIFVFMNNLSGYFQLKHLEEAYTTENWLVRIYKG